MGMIRELTIGGTYYFDNDRGTSEVCLKVLKNAGAKYDCEYFDAEGYPVRKSSFNKNGQFCRNLRPDNRTQMHEKVLRSHARQMGKSAAFEMAYGRDEEAFQKHLDKQRLKIAESQGIDPKLLGISREAMDEAISNKLDARVRGIFPNHISCRCIPTPIEGDNMNKLIKKLNGLEDKKFDQPMYEEKKIVVSLYSILKESEIVKSADFGDDCILTDLEIQGDKIVFSVRDGDVEIESEETKKE